MNYNNAIYISDKIKCLLDDTLNSNFQNLTTHTKTYLILLLINYTISSIMTLHEAEAVHAITV